MPLLDLPRPRSALSAGSYLSEVFGGETFRRWFSENPRSTSTAVSPNEIEEIRAEFEDAKRSFLKIPDALRKMPEMNPEGIYVNKNLRLDKVQVYGFDYDYTLAHYSSNLQSLTYDLAKEFLVNELKYPESCLQFQYDPSFPIRGLYFDKLKGCLLKLDFFGSIEPDGCFLGRQKVSREEIIKTYGSRHIGRDQARGLVGLMDFFCFSEVCLLADVVQHFIDAHLEYDASYVYEDVKRAIQHVHGSGILHSTILSDPAKYLMKNNQILKFLTMLKEKGKELFLLTNSPYYFIDGGMRFLLEAKFHIIQELLGRLHMTTSKCGEQAKHSRLVEELNEARIRCRSMMRNMFNASFGATFLADSGQESAFAYHIHHYADVYTSKPENFLLFPPEAWLHVPSDIKIMPHHIKVPSSLFTQQ